MASLCLAFSFSVASPGWPTSSFFARHSKVCTGISRAICSSTFTRALASFPSSPIRAAVSNVPGCTTPSAGDRPLAVDIGKAVAASLGAVYLYLLGVELTGKHRIAVIAGVLDALDPLLVRQTGQLPILRW